MKRNQVLLKWITTEEESNKEFEVQHSLDGNTWHKVGVLASKSKSETGLSAHIYEFIHIGFSTGKNIYRLLSVDFDGTNEYSESRVVVVSRVSNVKLFPNPATNILNIEGLDENQSMKVFNSLGAVLHVPTRQMGAIHQVELSNLAAGCYTIQVFENAKVVSSHNISVVK